MRFLAFLDARDFGVNPVALKELRQAVRGRFVIATLVLCLLAYIIAMATFVVGQQIESTSLERVAAGPAAFTALFIVLFTACVFFVPLYTGLRMMAERSDSNVDLLFITTLRPRSIVLGKLQSAAALTGLLFSAALPFLIFCYVLRGIDFLAILALSLAGFIVILSQSVLALFIGSLPASKPFKLLLGVVLFGVTLAIYSPMLAFAGQFMQYGGAAGVTIAGSRASALWVLSILLTVDVLLLFASIALMTPATANRAMPIRLLLSGLWIVFFAVAVIGAFRTSSTAPMTLWATALLSVIALVLLSSVGEREEWGRRVTRSIPRRESMRLLAFLFYSGGGGTIWAILMMTGTVIAYATTAPLIPARVAIDTDTVTRWMFEGSLCVIAYAFTALFLRRRFLSGRMPAKNTWAIALALFILGAVIPPIICIALFNNKPEFNAWFQIATIANPFPMTDTAPRMSRMLFLAAWALAVAAANAGWMKGMLQRFRRPGSTTTPAQAAGLPELAGD